MLYSITLECTVEPTCHVSRSQHIFRRRTEGLRETRRISLRAAMRPVILRHLDKGGAGTNR